MKDTNIMVPMGLPCGEKVTYGWISDHYMPKPGKFVGVWPWDFSVENLRTLRTKWGYTGVLASEGVYSDEISAGYQPDSMLFSISFDWPTQDFARLIDNYDVGYYYLGEPTNHKCGYTTPNKRMYTQSELYTVGLYIHAYRPSSKFVTDGYKRCDHFDVQASYSDILMYAAYFDWTEYWGLPCTTNMGWGPTTEYAWLEGNEDQRPAWTDMRSRYGSKFSQTWIATYEIGEFYNLFARARELGLNSVWIYGNGQDTNPPTPVPHHNDQWQNISDAAFYQGYLRKFVKDVRIYWRCTLPNPCNCDPTDPDSGWYIYKVVPEGGSYEIFN